MTEIRAQSADGVMHQFPEGTDMAVVDRVMKSYAADQPMTVQQMYGGSSPGASPPAQPQPVADVNAVAQGLVGGVGSAVAGVGRATTAAGAEGTKRQLAVMDAIDQGKGVPQDQDVIGYQFLSPEQRKQARADFSSADTELSKREPNALVKAGTAISGAASEMFPVAPENEGIQTGVGRMIGGVAPALAASAAGGPVGILGSMAIIGSQAYEGTYQDAIANGASPDDAENAARKSAAAQTIIQVAPVGRLIQRVPVPLRDGLMKTLFDLGQHGIELGGANALGTFANNYVAQQTFDPNRSLMRGVPQAGLEGAIAGGLIRGAGMGVQALRAPSEDAVAAIGRAPDVDSAIEAASAAVRAPPAADIPRVADILAGEPAPIPGMAPVERPTLAGVPEARVPEAAVPGRVPGVSAPEAVTPGALPEVPLPRGAPLPFPRPPEAVAPAAIPEVRPAPEAAAPRTAPEVRPAPEAITPRVPPEVGAPLPAPQMGLEPVAADVAPEAARPATAAPTTAAEARTVASDYYRHADAVGGELTPQFTNSFIDSAEKIAPQTEEGRIVTGDTAVTSLVDRMQGLRDHPLSLQAAQEIDEALGGLIDKEHSVTGMSKEGKHLQDLQTTLRNMIADAGEGDVQGGTQGFEALSLARKAWSQAAKMGDVERILNRAALTDNPATSIKSGIRVLLSNPSRVRGYSPAEIDALKDAASRGVIGGTLHVFGSRLTPLIAGGIGLSGGPISGLVTAGIAHAAGSVMRNVATGIQEGRAQNVLSVLGSGVPAALGSYQFTVKPMVGEQKTQDAAAAANPALQSPVQDAGNPIQSPLPAAEPTQVMSQTQRAQAAISALAKMRSDIEAGTIDKNDPQVARDRAKLVGLLSNFAKELAKHIPATGQAELRKNG